MPKYQVELTNGRRFVVDADSEELAHQAAMSYAAPPAENLDVYHQRARDLINRQAAGGRDISGGYLDKYLQGATLGFGDELVAAGRTALGAVADPVKHLGDPNYKGVGLAERYAYEKALEDERLKDAEKRTGALGTAAELAGGVGTAVGAAGRGLTLMREGMGLGARVAAGATEGAGYGALAGAGSGDGLNDRLAKAGAGAVGGALIGGAVPAAVAGAKLAAAAPLSNIAAMRDPAGAAATKFGNAVLDGGKNLNDVLQEVAAARAAGVPLTLADALGKPGQRLLYTAASAEGPGRALVTDAMDARQAAQGERISNLIAEHMGTTQTGRQAGRAMIDEARAASRPLYQAIPQFPEEITPRVESFLREPLMQQALRRGVQIQRNNALAAGEDLAGYSLPEFHRANNAGLNAFSFENYQAMKIGLDDLLEKYRDPTTGVLNLDAEGNSVLALRRALDEDLKMMFPGYAAADAAYAGPAAQSSAIRTGRSMVGQRMADNADTIAAMSPDQLVGARAGVADRLTRGTEWVSEGTNKANRLDNPGTRSLIEGLSVMPNAADDVTRRLAWERAMSRTREQAVGGSRTAENIADQKTGGIDARVLGAITDLVQGKVLGAARQAGQGLINRFDGNTPAVREELARIGLSDGASLQRLLRRATLDARRWRRRETRATQGLLGGSAAVVGGSQ